MHRRKWVKVAALLHDIGKVEISTDLIRKALELSENEKTLLESHTRKGARLIASVFHWIRCDSIRCFMRIFRCIAFIVVFLVMLPLPLFAEPPDAGLLMREQEPQRQLPQRIPEQQKAVERPALTDTGVKVTVTEIRFTGIEGLATQEDLNPLVADAIGKALSFKELQALADKVTAYLKQKGDFLARAYLPKQDITGGIIEIAVVQGRMEGEAVINRKAGVRLQESVPREIIKGAVHVRPTDRGQPRMWYRWQ